MKQTWSAEALSKILKENEFGARYRWARYHLFLFSPLLLFLPLFALIWHEPDGVSGALPIVATAVFIGYCVYWSTSIKPYPLASATVAYRHGGKAIWLAPDGLHYFGVTVGMDMVTALDYRPSRFGNDFCLHLNDGKQLVYPADFLAGPLLPNPK